MGFQLDKLSLQRLVGAHPDLVKVVQDCARNGTLPFFFGVSEGPRTLAQQKLDVARGFSETMKSRHLLSGTPQQCYAVDLVPLRKDDKGHDVMSWAWPPFFVLAREMKAAAARLHIPIEWGGDWTTLKDGPHFQLPWAQYPAPGGP